MPKKISELQRQLLERAAGEPITDAAAVDSGVSYALVHKNLVIWLPAEGEGSRLIVTEAGLAALAAANAKRETKAADDAGRGKPGPDAAPSDLGSKKGKSTRRQSAHSDPPDLPPVLPKVALPKGKLGALAVLLRRPEGACVEDMMAGTGWQAHSVRGAMSGALKKKLGFVIESEKAAAGRVYRIVDPGAA